MIGLVGPIRARERETHLPLVSLNNDKPLSPVSTMFASKGASARALQPSLASLFLVSFSDSLSLSLSRALFLSLSLSLSSVRLPHN